MFIAQLYMALRNTAGCGHPALQTCAHMQFHSRERSAKAPLSKGVVSVAGDSVIITNRCNMRFSVKMNPSTAYGGPPPFDKGGFYPP